MIETTPQGYIERARKAFEAVRKFNALHSRLIRATPSLTAEERRKEGEPFDPMHPRYLTKTEKLDAELARLYARLHFEPVEQVYAGRQSQVAIAMGDLFELLEAFGAKL